MFILSRRNHESVVIGDHHRLERMLKVTVMEIHAGRVKLGIELSEPAPVHRGEVLEWILAEERAETRIPEYTDA